MSQISELNALMPTTLDKTTIEYIAIFGNEQFTPNSLIDESSDFNCGAIANELEYVKGFIDYLTRTTDIANFHGTYLEKILYFFTGLRRAKNESDTQLRNRFNALVRRNNNASWITKWVIRDVFSYFFDRENIYVIENYVTSNLVVDGSFELDPSTNWVRKIGRSTGITYFLVGTTGSPKHRFFRWNNGVLTSLPGLTPAPSGSGSITSLAWRPDNSYVAVGTVGPGPYLYFYAWDEQNETLTKIADPSDLPTSIVRSVAWSPDGRYLAAGLQSSPYIIIYDWNSGSPVKIPDPATLPTGGYLPAVTWSPDGRYLAIAHANSPYITIYDWSSGSPVKIPDPAILPAGDSFSIAWSPNGRYLAVGHTFSPYITFYDWSSGSPVKIPNPVTLPSSSPQGIAWRNDSLYVALASGVSSNTFAVYDWTTGNPVWMSTPNDCARPVKVAWSPSGEVLAVGKYPQFSWQLPWVELYDFRTLQFVRIDTPHFTEMRSCTALCWYNTNDSLFIEGAGSLNITWDTANPFEGRTAAKFTVGGVDPYVDLSQTLTGVPQGVYVLSFFTKNGKEIAGNLFQVLLKRTSDGYYYNFNTLQWQQQQTSYIVSQDTSTRYEIRQAFVVVDVNGIDIALHFRNIEGITDPYTFYIDLVEFGPILSTPSVKVMLVNVGNQAEFLSAWPGTNDPIPELDYNFASYLGQAYIQGQGAGSLPYFTGLLQIVKPFGVQSMIQVITQGGT